MQILFVIIAVLATLICCASSSASSSSSGGTIPDSYDGTIDPRTIAERFGDSGRKRREKYASENSKYRPYDEWKPSGWEPPSLPPAMISFAEKYDDFMEDDRLRYPDRSYHRDLATNMCPMQTCTDKTDANSVCTAHSGCCPPLKCQSRSGASMKFCTNPMK
jgi:hypothetical protein